MTAAVRKATGMAFSASPMPTAVTRAERSISG